MLFKALKVYFLRVQWDVETKKLENCYVDQHMLNTFYSLGFILRK